MSKPITLSQLKAINPRAYEKYLEMLAEDCRDEFYVFPDGNINVLARSPHHPTLLMHWDGDKATVSMDIGSGWEVSV